MCQKEGLIHFHFQDDPSLMPFADAGMKETDATVGHEMSSHTVFLSCQLYSQSLYRQWTSASLYLYFPETYKNTNAGTPPTFQCRAQSTANIQKELCHISPVGE